MSPISGISTLSRVSADLFAAPPASSPAGKLGSVAIDDCPTFPRKFPVPPPPPSPFAQLVPSRFLDEWCGTVPRKFPFPPPPPPPWVEGINQLLSSR